MPEYSQASFHGLGIHTLVLCVWTPEHSNIPCFEPLPIFPLDSLRQEFVAFFFPAPLPSQRRPSMMK